MLYMINCSLPEIPQGIFNESRILRHIDLSHNDIDRIHRNAFKNLNGLHTLIIRHNNLRTIAQIILPKPNTFIHGLVYIDFSFMGLKFLPPRTFQNAPMLRLVNLSFNPFVTLPAEVFSWSQEYFHIDLSGVQLSRMHSTNIYSVQHIDTIDGEVSELCCLSKSISDCRVKKKTISSCEYLISPLILQICIWVNGTVIAMLNAFVIFYRVSNKKSYKKWSNYTNAYIINMAISDLMMGLYVLVLAIVHISFSGRYASVTWSWRSSVMCKILAVLSTVASEVSLMSLAMLTYLQLTTIKHVYGTKRHVKLFVSLSILSAWLIAVALSTIPVLDLQYFGRTFLSGSGTCLLYPLASGNQMAKEYAVTFWIIINLLMLVLMAGFQFGLGIKIYKSSQNVAGRRTKKNTHTQHLFVLLGLVAFLCWVPVLTIMLLVMIGVQLPATVSEYVIILMLPLKAVMNPLLYTVRIMKLKKAQ